jgi:hypothetical protein
MISAEKTRTDERGEARYAVLSISPDGAYDPSLNRPFWAIICQSLAKIAIFGFAKVWPDHS